MLRDKIIYKDGRGNRCTGYAILSSRENPKETDYVWCFNDKHDNYGFTIHTSNIIKVY